MSSKNESSHASHSENVMEFNETLKAALEILPLPCLCLNLRGEILYSNPAAVRFLQMKAGSGQSASIADYSLFKQPDGMLSTEKAELRILEAVEKGLARFNWTHVSGNSAPILSEVALHHARFNGEDAVIGFIMEQDSSGMLHREALSNLQLRTLLDAAPFSITLWDDNNNIVDCNIETFNLFKTSGKQEYFDKFLELSPPMQPDGTPSYEGITRSIALAKEKGKVTLEWMHRALDGEEIPAEVTLIYTENNGVPQVMSYVKDLREQKRYIRQIIDAERRTQIMLDAVPLACDFWDDAHANVIDCNQEALNLFGIATKEEYCEKFPQLSPEYQPNGRLSSEMAAAKVEEAFSNGSSEFEWMHQKLNGEPIPSEVKLVRVEWNNRQTLVGSIRDIRQLKATMQDLRSAKEVAEAANQAKSQFLSNMSHEIRTPMNAVLGMAELLTREQLTPRQEKYVRDIKLSAEALLDIINDILDFSKIEAGKLEILPVSFDLHEALENMRSMFLLIAQRKGVEFFLDIAENCPRYLFADDIRLRQILINIVGNAIKFTAAGHVRLSVRCAGDVIFFDIEDTGIGIHSEELPRLFDEFEQLDSKNNRQAGGSGLGLSITRSLVGLMGGEISADSEYGKGSVFHISLPLTPGDEKEVQRGFMPDESIHAPDAKVLVVDDNEVNLTVAGGLLKLFGIEIDRASSASEALDMIEINDYDLVFMDHMMPVMDGVEATQRLRERGEADLPVIALTANAVGGVREMFLAAGMNDYLSKPINPALLNAMLLKWLPSGKIAELRAPAGGPKTPPVSPLLAFVKENIREIDVELALNRVGGQAEAVEKSLRILARRLPEVRQRLAAFLERGDMQGFAIDVHGLKGSLASVGAMGPSELAQRLENAAKDGDAESCRRQFPALEEYMAILRSGLGSACQKPAGAPRGPSGNADELKLRLVMVRDLLDRFEADEALELIRELGKTDYGETWSALLLELDRLAEEFEFEKALALIDAKTRPGS